MMNDLHQSKPFIWSLLAIFCVIWFVMLGTRTLVPTDEGRYAEMPREMVATGDWITPRLNGIKYFEKPPLQIWATAAVYEVFGLGEWQARLWTGVCGLFGIFLTALAGRRLYGSRVGFGAGLVLASSFLWAALGHINTLDMGLAGMMTLALSGLLIAQRNDADATERRNWMIACWAGMALSVMSKGLIGIVLPGAILILYSLWSRDWKIWTRLHFGIGLAVFFAITVPWFVLVTLKNPEFPRFFFIHEHFQRFTTKVHHRDGPWYYFIPLLLIGILPWLGVLLQSLWSARSGEGTGFQPKKMLFTWAAFIFVFFSISDSKLPSYILPIFPALALLIALYLQNASRTAWALTAGITATLSIAGLAMLPRLSRLASNPVEVVNYHAAQPWAIAALGLLLIASLVVLWWLKKDRRELAIAATLTLACAGFLSGQLLMAGSEAQGRYRAGLSLVPGIEAELTPTMPLYSVGMYDQTLPFYLRRTMTLVEHADELEFGLQQEPQLWLPTQQPFLDRWQNGPKAIAITRPPIYRDLLERGVPMRVIAQDSRRVVITNDIKPQS